MSVVIGINAKLWYRAWTPGETPEYGAWGELSNTRNVTLNLTSNEADVTVRANDGWRATVPTVKDASIDFEMVYDTTDAGFTAIRTAYFDGSSLNVRVLDGGTTQSNGNGLDAHVRITNFVINQGNEEAVTVSVSMKPTYAASNLAPVWYVSGTDVVAP